MAISIKKLLCKKMIIFPKRYCSGLIKTAANGIQTSRLKNSAIEEEYDHAFRVYTENNNIFYGKEYFEFRKNAAVKWCIKNNIKYRQDAVWQERINGNDFWRIK